jgi:hypothetical protein
MVRLLERAHPADAIDVSGRAPVLVDEINAIREQAAVGDEKTIEVDRW